MSNFYFLRDCKKAADSILKSFHFNCRRIAPSASKDYALSHEIYYFYFDEYYNDYDSNGGSDRDDTELARPLNEIHEFISNLRDNNDISLIYGSNSEMSKNKELFSVLDELVSDQVIWTFEDYDDLGEADYYDPAISSSLIVLDYCSSDASIIKDCTHLLNRCWGNSTSIIYISLYHDASFPISSYKDLGSEPHNVVEGITSQVESCLNIIRKSSTYKSLSHEIVNEKAYISDSWQLPIYIPIPHLFFKQLDRTSPDQISRLFDDPEASSDIDYDSTIIQLLKGLKDDYSSIHLFIIDSFGGSIQELKEDSCFKNVIQEFKDKRGFTVDSSYYLQDWDYGEPLYYEDRNALFVVLNVLSSTSTLHSQAIPLVHWLSTGHNPSPVEVFKSLIISFYKDSRHLQTSLASTDSGIFDGLRTCVKDWPIHSGLPHKYFFDYYPTRFTSISEYDDKNRNLIWAFKNNGMRADMGYQEASECVFTHLKEILAYTFGGLLHELTLFCVPTSTQKTYSDRFERISSRLCDELGMLNAFYHVRYLQDGEPKHLGGRAEPVVEFDASFFSGRFVIMFDDIYTLGRTSSYRKKQLQEMNAQVIGLITIGKTVQ